MVSWKVISSTFGTGLTASETLDATIRLVAFSMAMSTMRCVMMPSKIIVSTSADCCSFSAN